MRFLENGGYTATWRQEIAHRPLSRRICAEDIGLLGNASSKVRALRERRRHAGTPLSSPGHVIS